MLETAFWLTGFPINNSVCSHVSLISLGCILILSSHFFLGFPSKLPFCSRFRLNKSVCILTAHTRNSVTTLATDCSYQISKQFLCVCVCVEPTKQKLRKCAIPNMSSFHGPKLVLCVSAIDIYILCVSAIDIYILCVSSWYIHFVCVSSWYIHFVCVSSWYIHFVCVSSWYIHSHIQV